jgi:hypothetical protein
LRIGLRRIFGSRRDEVTGEWRKLHNELNDLYFSPNIVRVIKSRMRWAGNTASMRERHIYGVLLRNPEEKGPLGDQGIDGMTVLRWIFRNWDVGVWTGLSCLRIVRWQALVYAVMNLQFP